MQWNQNDRNNNAVRCRCMADVENRTFAAVVDRQPGDVTDGSVDYYDFEWGEPVVYDESTMEPVLFPCETSCTDACLGTEEPRGGNEEPPSECSDNRPEQADENVYPIVQL